MFYHGSSTCGLARLQPFVSEHKQSYVYFSTNLPVAALYTVHAVERPFNWFPYGFDSKQTPVYDEYYPDAMADVYKGKTGYIYQCDTLPGMLNPTNIYCAFVSEKPVDVDSCMVLDDVYDFLLQCESEGSLIIKRFAEFYGNSREQVDRMIVSEIESKHLKSIQSGYGDFLRKNFPDAWEKGGASQ